MNDFILRIPKKNPRRERIRQFKEIEADTASFGEVRKGMLDITIDLTLYLRERVAHRAG
jgi:hypothetical protein